MARRAQRAFQFERGEPETSFITFGYWDNLKQGLLAGEKLQYDLRRMDAAYLEKNKREYEITKHISLATLAPEELLKLRATGACEISIPESEFDLDFPGLYMRRIKSVSLTIPCVAGPYSGVNCKLTLLNNKIRKGAVAQTNYDAGPFIDEYCMMQAIATSTAQNDSGVFELNFRDERYLPFEGAGAISTWRVELPKENNLIDLESVDDVVLHLRYMARDGGGPLKAKAMAALATPLEGAERPRRERFRLFSVKTEFPTEWTLFLNPPATQNYQELSLALDPVRFEAHRGAESLSITGMTLFARWVDTASYRALTTAVKLYVTPPEAEVPLEATVTLVASASDVALAPFAIGIVEPDEENDPVGTSGQWVFKVKGEDLELVAPSTPANTVRYEVPPEASDVWQLKPEALEDLWILCTYDQLPAE
jgi:hypothetical protein